MRKKKRLGLISLLVIFAFLLSVLTILAWADDTDSSDETLNSDDLADEALESLGGELDTLTARTLTVMVGYFGGPYVDKATFYIDEANSCLTDCDDNSLDYLFQDEYYTFYDGQAAFYIDTAKIITLEDFFDYAGIDINSIQYLHLRTSDKKNPTFSWTTLTQDDRFAFPKIEKLGIQYDFDLYKDNYYDTVYDNRVIVPMGLAIQDNWHSVGTDGEDTTFNAVRFLYGQLNPKDGSGENEDTSGDNFKYWKWIYAMAVQLGGTPQTNVTVDLDDKLGSTYHVSVNLSVLQLNGRTTDLDDSIAAQVTRTLQESLQGSSTNREVLDVGNITVNGDGTISFDITVTGEDGSAKVEIGGDLSESLQAAIGVVVEDGVVTVTNEKGNVSGSAITEKVDLQESISGQTQEDSSEESTDTANSSGGSSTEESNSESASSGGSSTEESNSESASSGGSSSSTEESNSESTSFGGNSFEIQDQDQNLDVNDTPSSFSEIGVSQETANSTQNVESLDSSGEKSDAEIEDPEDIASDGSEEALVDTITQETELAPEVNSIRINKLTIDSNEGGEQDWRETEMAEDAVAMGEVEQPNWLWQTGLIALCMLILGAVVYYFSFKKQTRR